MLANIVRGHPKVRGVRVADLAFQVARLRLFEPLWGPPPQFSGGRFAPESSSSRPLVTLPAPMRLDMHGVWSQVCCAVFLNTSFLVGSTNPGTGGYNHHAGVGDPGSERPASSAGARGSFAMV